MPRSPAAMHLLESDLTDQQVDRALAEMMLGMITALRQSALTIEQAEQELFNLTTRESAESRGINANLLEAMEWGMQLDDVQALAPDGLGESYDAIAGLCQKVLTNQAAEAA